MSRDPEIMDLEHQAQSLITKGKLLLCGDFAEICRKDSKEGEPITPESLQASPIIALAYFTGIVDDLGSEDRPTINGIRPDPVGIAAAAFSKYPCLKERTQNCKDAVLGNRVFEAKDLSQKASKIYEGLISVIDANFHSSSMEGITEEMQHYPALCSVIRSYAFGEYPQVDLNVPELISLSLAYDIDRAADWSDEADPPSP